jgi:hypothetical protein
MGSERLCLCPRDFTPADAPGRCKVCGRQLVECEPGEAGDLSRRPLVDASGRVLTRAPVWWLRKTVASLMGHYDKR